MPMSKNKTRVSVDKDIVDKFEYVYPAIKELFVTRALKLALQDKDYFERVFFNPIFLEVK